MRAAHIVLLSVFVTSSALAEPIRFEGPPEGRLLQFFRDQGGTSLDLALAYDPGTIWDTNNPSPTAITATGLDSQANSYYPHAGYSGGAGVLLLASPSDPSFHLQEGGQWSWLLEGVGEGSLIDGSLVSGENEYRGAASAALGTLVSLDSYRWGSFESHLTPHVLSYVPMSLTLSGQTHYGWVAFEREQDNPVVGDVTSGTTGVWTRIFAWGYETDPGTPSVAGAAPTPCMADLNNDGFLDSGDISVFVSLFLAGDLAVDLNSDGFLDSGDISAFVEGFLAGC